MSPIASAAPVSMSKVSWTSGSRRGRERAGCSVALRSSRDISFSSSALTCTTQRARAELRVETDFGQVVGTASSANGSASASSLAQPVPAEHRGEDRDRFFPSHRVEHGERADRELRLREC
jgi:hypothetical protein